MDQHKVEQSWKQEKIWKVWHAFVFAEGPSENPL